MTSSSCVHNMSTEAQDIALYDAAAESAGEGERPRALYHRAGHAGITRVAAGTASSNPGGCPSTAPAASSSPTDAHRGPRPLSSRRRLRLVRHHCLSCAAHPIVLPPACATIEFRLSRLHISAKLLHVSDSVLRLSTSGFSVTVFLSCYGT